MLSFVIPAYNEQAFIARTIASIDAVARELVLQYEIVVADDASTDATAHVARTAGARVVGVCCRQISATRNAGARAARGDRLVFVDADTHVNVSVVRRALSALDSGAVGGGAGVRFPAGTPWWGHAMAASTAWFMRRTLLAAGCFIFCTRAAFEAAGGFDESTYAGEEIHFSRALKALGRFAILRTRVATSPRKVEGRGFWEMMRINFDVMRKAGFEGRIRRREDAGFWYDR